MILKNIHHSSITATLRHKFKDTELYRLQSVHHKTIYKQNVSNNIITPFLSHYMITENS